LVHVALVMDSFASVQAMYQRLKAHGVAVRATDHGMTKSVYCTDPEGNGIELYCEVPEANYLAADYQPKNAPLDIEAVVPA
jgi:catechol 2,3-dioxygenase